MNHIMGGYISSMFEDTLHADKVFLGYDARINQLASSLDQQAIVINKLVTDMTVLSNNFTRLSDSISNRVVKKSISDLDRALGAFTPE